MRKQKQIHLTHTKKETSVVITTEGDAIQFTAKAPRAPESSLKRVWREKLWMRKLPSRNIRQCESYEDVKGLEAQ